MSILTETQYKTLRSEWDILVLAMENKEMPDLAYRIAKRRYENLNAIFELHWNKTHQKEAEMTEQERVARALTRWVNGKRQDPLPDWDALSDTVRTAYMEQAAEAISVMQSSHNQCLNQEVIKT